MTDEQQKAVVNQIEWNADRITKSLEAMGHMTEKAIEGQRITNAYLRILTRTVEVASIVIVGFLVLHYVFKVI